MTRALLLLAALASAQAAPRWELSYFYDEARSNLNIVDLAWPSAARGIAAGIVTGRDGDERGAAAVTADGGRTWTLLPIKEIPHSLFFLDETHGWMVTAKGLWRTVEAGRSWTKISSPKDVLRVHFIDENRGFAVGARKSMSETKDGGKTWKRVAAADTPKAKRDYTVYSNVVFFTKEQGVVTGWNRPPRRDDDPNQLPAWIDPERAARRDEWPNMSIILQTQDGGVKWDLSTSSLFGRITRVRFDSTGRILALIEFSESFPYPSEVYYWSPKGEEKSARIYREKTRAVTDVFAFAGGAVYLAATPVEGRLRLPIAVPLKVLKSTDLASWSEMEVDYRATARHATFASSGKDLWMATDTGMILKLVE